MVEKSADITFLSAFLMVFRNVTVVLVVPLLLALLSRRGGAGLCRKSEAQEKPRFLFVVYQSLHRYGSHRKNITHSEVGGWLLALLLLLPLVVTIAQFAIGKAVGRPFGASISAGQALGQKNTVVGIWLTLTFLNPLAAVAPGAYVIWQNMVNAWQLWYKGKYGKLKY